PDKRDDGIEILRRHGGVASIGHRRLELVTITRDALRNRTFDFVVAPLPETRRWIRRDVGRDGFAPWSPEGAATLAARTSEIVHHGGTFRRVAFQAMGDGQEIAAAGELVG